jgi:uncharacterized protein YpmS
MEDKYKKIMENIDDMKKVSGFIVTAPGDESAGILPSKWEIEGDFYFDNREEFDLFKEQIKILFENNYCGESVDVISFEEHQLMIDLENEL